MTEGLLAKKCRTCGEWKPQSSEFFARQAVNADGLSIYCKCCSRAAAKRYTEAAWPRRLAARPEHKKCSKCSEVKPASEFLTQRTSRDSLDYYCRECRYTHINPLRNKRARNYSEGWKRKRDARNRLQSIKLAVAEEILRRMGINLDQLAQEKYDAEFSPDP